MSARYYGIQRSSEYLAHYGVKGMRWGVRRALRDKPGRDKRLMRQYLKANNKLVKLKRKENIGNNKADAQYYGKIAKKALKVSAAGLGAATGLHAGYQLLGNHNIDLIKNRSNNADYWEQVNKLREQNGWAPDYITLNDPSLKPFYEKDQATISRINRNGEMMGVAAKAKQVAGGITAAGLATAAVTGAKAANAKWRASDKGHAKMVQKRQNWEKEMRQAFKGTKYAGLPDTGPIIARQIAQKKKKRRS